MIPIVEDIKANEVITMDSIGCPPKHPRAIILIPTNELAFQVKSVVKDMSKAMKIRAQAFLHGTSSKVYYNILASPVDILIMTPNKLLGLLKEKKLFLSNLTHLVLDEGDTLLDEKVGFGTDVSEIIKAFPLNREKNPKVIVVAATVTLAFQKNLSLLSQNLRAHYAIKSDNTHVHKADFNNDAFDFYKVLSPGLHKAPRTLVQKFVQIHAGGNEKQKLTTDIIKANKQDKVVIFVDKVASMETLRGFFHSSGIQHYTWQKEEQNNAKKKPREGERLQNSVLTYDCLHGFLNVQVKPI